VGKDLSLSPPDGPVKDRHHTKDQPSLNSPWKGPSLGAMTRFRPLAAVLLTVTALISAACAPAGTSARITAYGTPGAPDGFKDRTVAIRALAGQTGSLEYDRAAQRMAGELTAMGARVVTDGADAPWIVTFTYGTDGGRVELYDRPVMTGHVRNGPPPFFGDPWESRTFARTVHTHWLVLDLHDGPTLGDRDPREVKPTNEVRVETRSASGALAAALPTLIRAAVQAFPGEDGRTTTRRVTPPAN
jgi:hypothetical protein